MNADGGTESDGDLPFLKKALDNLWSEQALLAALTGEAL